MTLDIKATRIEKESSSFLRLLSTWLLISSVYYADSLFTGNFMYGLDENIPHKVAKYLVMGSFSLYFIVKSKSLGGFLFASLMILVLATAFTADAPMPVLLTSTTLAVCAPFILLSRTITHDDYEYLAKFIAYTGIFVALVSVVEVHFLADKFQEHWARFGGIRSISTLYNPNNLGLYLGACAILIFNLPWSTMAKTIAYVPLTLSLIYSGSRTAWVLLVLFFLSQCLRFILKRDIQISRTTLMGALVSSILLFPLILTFFFLYSSEAAHDPASNVRQFDVDTAILRLADYVRFFSGLDWWFLLPDFNGQNLLLIQDSGWLVLINNLGALVSLAIFGIFIGFLAGAGRPVNAAIRSWRYVATYFLIAQSVFTVVGSFPNNQLMFIALSAFFVGRRGLITPVKSDYGNYPARATTD